MKELTWYWDKSSRESLKGRVYTHKFGSYEEVKKVATFSFCNQLLHIHDAAA